MTNQHNFVNNGYNCLKFSQNVAHRYLLIVNKFWNDSFILFGVIKNFGRGQKWQKSQLSLLWMCTHVWVGWGGV